MTQRYLIIGASAAGMGVLSKLRTLDPTADIVCVAAQSLMPNNTCLIADCLAGAKTEAAVYIKDRSFFDENNIDLRLSTTVESIDADSQMVFLSDGSALEFDKLFLGTGTTALLPAPFTKETAGVFTFHTLDDVQALNAVLATKAVQQAVVVGAGLSGIECADALAQRGVRVDLLDMQQTVLHRFVDEQGSRVIEGWMEKQQVTFHPGTTLANLSAENGCVAGAVLSSGATIPCQMVIFAIGGRPNLTLAESAGLDIRDKAVVVDQFLRTSNENIYAGGDLCRIKDLATGKWVRSCNWPDAALQGMYAASNMAGQPRAYPGTVIIVGSKFFGSGFVTCGPVNQPQTSYETQKVVDEKGYRCLVYDNNVLKGFCMIGSIDHVGQLRKYIVAQQPLSAAEKELLLK